MISPPPPPTIEKVTGALANAPGSTAAELAAATGLGRSTVTNQLAALERAGNAHRTDGGRDGARRTPDRWKPAAPADPKARAGQRLRPGQLDTLVLDHLANCKEPAGPAAIANALGRSSGAVANCLTRLTASGQLHKVSDRPRRYLAPPQP